jgi:hypothetical protein
MQSTEPELVARMRKAAKAAVYLATDAAVAGDISDMLKRAADIIDGRVEAPSCRYRTFTVGAEAAAIAFGAGAIGIVDEREGGVILWASRENAQHILDALISAEARRGDTPKTDRYEPSE